MVKSKSKKNIAEIRLTDKAFIEKLVKEPVGEFRFLGNKAGGFIGEITPVEIKTKSGAVHHIMYKGLTPGDTKAITLCHHFGLFWKENLFYKIIAPEMEKMSQNPLPIAKMYDCLNNDESDFLVLEDLRPLGYEVPKVHPGFSFEETSLVLLELGAFHAKGYKLIQDKGRDYFKGDLSNLLYHCFDNKNDPSHSHWHNYNTLASNVFNKIRDRVTDDLANKIDKVCSRVIDHIQAPYHLAKEGKYFSVISHGDLWANNILFKYSEEDKENKKPLAVKFIDFQQSRLSSIYDDLYYFIYTCTSPQFRKEHLNSILDTYYGAFVQELQIMGEKIPYFTKQRFTDEFFENILSAFSYNLFALPFHLGVFPPPDMAKAGDIKEEEVNGHDQEENKLFSVDEMCQGFFGTLPPAFQNSDKAMDRLEDLVQEFSDMNAL